VYTVTLLDWSHAEDDATHTLNHSDHRVKRWPGDPSTENALRLYAEPSGSTFYGADVYALDVATWTNH